MTSKISKVKRRFLIMSALVFFGLSITGIFLLLRLKRAEDNKVSLRGGKNEGIVQEDKGLVWEKYSNNQFKFSLYYPKFLYKREVENHGGYLKFITFFENDYTTAKGIAVGVREGNLEDEVARLRVDLERGFDVELKRQDMIKVDGQKAVELIYKPVDKAELEPRAVVVITGGSYVYSISTVPEQIDKIISSFEFL